VESCAQYTFSAIAAVNFLQGFREARRIFFSHGGVDLSNLKIHMRIDDEWEQIEEYELESEANKENEKLLNSQGFTMRNKDG